MKRALLLLLAGSAACAGIEPKKEPPLTTDAAELFRRARFKELAETDRASFAKVLERLRPRAQSQKDQELEQTARLAYRRGDGKAALEALRALHQGNKTRTILDALLAHVDVEKPLFAVHAWSSLVHLPLDRAALAEGYAVISARVGDRDARLLWDTGATETVISDQVADALGLQLDRVQLIMPREKDAFVVRFEAGAVERITLPEAFFANVPVIVSELHTVLEHVNEKTRIDGFLSPQLLIRNGCFAVDREHAELTIGFDAKVCAPLLDNARAKEPLFSWDGQVFVNARIHETRDLAVALETGSPISYLRTDAARYLPAGTVDATSDEAEGEIAHRLAQTIDFSCAGRTRAVSTVDLQPRRDSAHDDLGTIGTDILLAGKGFVVSFVAMELASR